MQKAQGHKPPVLAIDIGGTKILAALVSEDGLILAKEYTPTQANEGPDAVIKRLLSAIGYVLDSKNLSPSQISAISIAAAGPVDMEKGVVTASPNLPGWTDIPLKRIVEERFKTKVFLINDANAAALGEHRFGAGKGAKDLVFLTVSTGIGGGIIIDGKLYVGSSGAAGEPGHMTIDTNGPKCNCGNIGCLEMLASGTALAREAQRLIREGAESSLVEMVGGRIEDVTGETVSIAARNRDPLALEVVAQIAGYLGAGMVSLVNLLNPELIVIGGGVAKLGDLLFEPVRQIVRERAFKQSSQVVRIVPAQLGDDAGVVGAAAYAFDFVDSQ